MKIRIGSRGSRLAVVQAENVAALLRAAHPGLETDLVTISTQGDRDAASSLASIGGKGVFVKEIEDALLRREIDLAVHSLKDVPQALPAGLRLGPPPKREDARDVVISRFGELLRELPKGSTVGTSSPRRVAQIRHQFAKRIYNIEPIRGNVDTRIQKVHDGKYDAIVLAAAGVNRLGLSGDVAQILEPEEMLPAPCQGCLGLELRSDDAATLELLSNIRDAASDITSRAERSFLQGIGGDCLVPLGAHSVIVNDELRMSAKIWNLEGTVEVAVSEAGPASAPEFVGARLAGKLLFEGGSEILLGPPPTA